MLCFVRKTHSFSLTAITALLFSSIPVRADVLIDYWADQLTQGPSGPTYGELREEFAGKISSAQAAVAACGGCAEAQAELDALMQEERAFQSMAARALTMTGQPPAAFRMLGISPPSFADYAASFPSTYESGEGRVNVNPDWLADTPDYCQQPVREYLSDLKNYQDKAKTSSLDFLKMPGGQYYEQSRVFRACRLKDHAEFERLEALRKARTAGEIHAEFEPIGPNNRREAGTIYYGAVPEDFIPPMPPPDVVRRSFAEEDYRRISIISSKKVEGNLTSAVILPYSGSYLPERSGEGCRAPRAERTERAKRHCEDMNEIYRFEPFLLQCGYRATDEYGVVAHRIALFWFDERVEFARLDYLLPRDHNHPLTEFPGARRTCPPNWQQASAELQAYQQELADQREKIEEIPMTRVLPESEWLRERREAYRIAAERKQERMKATDAYDLPGYYAFDYERAQTREGVSAGRGRSSPPGRAGMETITWDGKPVSGNCIIAADPTVSGPVYPAACWTDSNVTVGKVTKMHGVTFNLAAMPTNQFLLEEGRADALVSNFGGENITLRRRHDLVPLGDFPLEGDFLLQLAFGGDHLQAYCNFEFTSDKINFQMVCIDEQGRHLRSGAMYSSRYPTAQMLPLRWLTHFPSWQAKYAGKGRGITLGGMGISGLFAAVDPAFKGELSRDARLLLFGGVGYTGSLQRIEKGDSPFGGEDPANVMGHWVGDFQCSKTRDMKAELYLKDEGEGQLRDVSGTFVYRDSRFGEERLLSYKVVGEYLSGVGALKLEPGEWIKTVPQVGYDSFGLRAAASFVKVDTAEGDARISGDLADERCADIQLVRVTRTVPDSIVFESKPDTAVEAGLSPEKPDETVAEATVSSGAVKTADVPAGLEVKLPADSFSEGMTVPVSVTGLPGNSQDWVAISKAGQADNAYVSYRYTGGVTEGTWNLKSGPPGDYEVRVYLNWPTGGYNPVLRRPIKVVSAEEAVEAGLIEKLEIQLAARSFVAGAPIEVTVVGLPGNSQDWVAISRAGAGDNSYVDYDYTKGVTQGTWTYSMSEPGDYEVRVYLNWPTGGYNPVLREPISVTE